MRSKHSGEPKALTKTKELNIHTALQAANIEFEYQKYIPFRSCGLEGETTCAFLDFVIVTSWGVIVLEVDERTSRLTLQAAVPEGDVLLVLDVDVRCL